MTFKLSSERLEQLSQFSNAVLSPIEGTRVSHYQTGARKYSPFILPLTKFEIAHRLQWSREQQALFKTNESTAVMSFLIKEHNA